MPRVPLILIADDLTGAAEIAAIGHRHGLTASVLTGDPTFETEADLIVFDTDSRLDDARTAAEKITALAAALAKHPRALLYKKTDSVLRGPVRAELEALACSLDRSRVLLVPANPALGRTVQSGRYTIHGVALHETAFVRDPHHPANTSEVRELLGAAGAFPLTVASPSDQILAAGIVIGNAASVADLTAWAQRTLPETILAGAGEFFAALLRARGLTEAPRAGAFASGSPVLVISGTTSPAGTVLREAARRSGVPIISMSVKILETVSALATTVQTQLAATGRALVVFDGPVSTDPKLAAAIREAFALLTRELVACDAVRHLVVEGGATAAAITHALGWHELRLAHEWAPGVASLRPAARAGITLTMKPGSYAWPAALWQNITDSGTNLSRA